MSEGIIEVSEELSDKEINFEKVREQLAEKDARLAELEPLAVEKAVRSAGFDPDTPAGKALARLAVPGSDADAVKSLAEELGFEAASRPVLTPTEQAAVQSADGLRDLNSVTSSDEPPTANQAIEEAQAAGDWGLSGRLKLQQFLGANG